MNPRWERDERFADWVDGRLPPAERERLERDLEADPELRSQLEDYRAAVDWLRRDADGERAPEGLVDAVMARVDAEGATPERTRRWLPLLSSVAAAAALVAIGVFLWSAERGGPTREDAAALSSREIEPGLAVGRDLADRDLSEQEVRFEGAPSKAWKDLERAQRAAAEARPVGENARVLHMSEDPVAIRGKAEEQQEGQRLALPQAAAEPVTGTGGAARPEGAKKGVEPTEGLKYARPPVAMDKQADEGEDPTEAARDRLSKLFFEDREAKDDLGRGRAGQTRAREAEKELALGSLVVLVTVPGTASVPKTGAAASTATPQPETPQPESKAKVRQRAAQRRAEAEPEPEASPSGAVDPALSLVQSAPMFASNVMPPVVLEVPPVLLQHGAAGEGVVPPQGAFQLATGDRLFAVTGQQAQLAPYLSQLSELVERQQGRIDLVRTRPGEDFGLAGGVGQFVQAQTPVLGWAAGAEKRKNGGDAVDAEDLVLVVVRSTQASAVPGEKAPDEKAGSKKR